MLRKQTILTQAIRFVLVGGLATALHWGIYLLGMLWLPANPAYALGYILSFFFNFMASAHFTFQTTPSWHKFLGMAGAHGINFILHMGLLNLFLCLAIPKNWIPLPVYLIAMPVNFILVRIAFLYNKKPRRPHH